jgi:hypothetical protein
MVVLQIQSSSPSCVYPLRGFPASGETLNPRGALGGDTARDPTLARTAERAELVNNNVTSVHSRKPCRSDSQSTQACHGTNTLLDFRTSLPRQRS